MDEILLDSSYLLPIFGISLELRDFESTFMGLQEKYDVKYNPVSLIETKWAVLKRTRRLKGPEKQESFQRYRQGLISLQRDRALQSCILTNEIIEEFSDLLLTEHGIDDYFDRQIYSTAGYLQCILLTEDQTLHELFKRAAGTADLPGPNQVMRWKDLLSSQ